MGKIMEYQKTSAFDANDVLLKDGANGTKIISVEDAANAFANLNGTAASIADLQSSLASSAYVTDMTESLTMIEIEDGADNRLMEAAIIGFAPEFSGSGEVSPTNPRSMKGATSGSITCSGKNLFDKNDYRKLKISCTVTSGSTTGTVVGVQSDSAWMALPGGVTYAISCSTHSSIAFRVTATAELPVSTNNYKTPILLTISDPSADTIIFEAPAETKWIGFTLRTASSTDVTTIDAAVEGLQVEVASAATEYESFVGNHATVILPEEAGTVYRGVYSFITGKLTVTHGFKQFDGTENWTLYGANGTPYFGWTPDERAGSSYGTFSSHLKQVTLDSSNDNVGVTTFAGSNVVAIRPGASIANTVANLKTWLAAQATAGTPLQIVYPIATPHVYMLSPSQLYTILGKNYIFGDGGWYSQIRYVADLKMFIARKNKEDRSMISVSEVSTKATRNYSIGDYLSIGTKLYRVTSNIASGGTITSSNVVETTVGEELTALRNS